HPGGIKTAGQYRSIAAVAKVARVPSAIGLSDTRIPYWRRPTFAPRGLSLAVFWVRLATISRLGDQFMRALGYLFVLVLALLISGTASAQEGKGWLGADVLDVTKAEADKLKWDAPRGAKVGVVATGSPAEKAGLKSGDVILSIDRMMLETSSDADAA